METLIEIVIYQYKLKHFYLYLQFVFYMDSDPGLVKKSRIQSSDERIRIHINFFLKSSFIFQVIIVMAIPALVPVADDNTPSCGDIRSYGNAPTYVIITTTPPSATHHQMWQQPQLREHQKLRQTPPVYCT